MVALEGRFKHGRDDSLHPDQCCGADKGDGGRDRCDVGGWVGGWVAGWLGGGRVPQLPSGLAVEEKRKLDEIQGITVENKPPTCNWQYYYYYQIQL